MPPSSDGGPAPAASLATTRGTNRSSSGVVLLGLAVIALSAGVYQGDPAAIALGCAFAAIPVTLWYLTGRVLNALVVRQIAPDSAFEDDEVTVAIRLENPHWLPAFHPRFVEYFGPEGGARKEVVFADRVDSGDLFELDYTGNCSEGRGVYGFGPTMLYLSDPFGWFERRRGLASNWRIKVYPRVASYTVPDALGADVRQVVDDVMGRARGPAAEYVGVRDYRAGDPIRSIHWGLTAHRGEPVVREHAGRGMDDYCFVLDLHRSACVGVGRTSTLELSVKVAVTLAAEAVERRRSYSILTGLEEERGSLAPGRGQSQFHAVLELLVEARATSPRTLDEVLLSALSVVAPGTAIVVPIAPCHHESATVRQRLASLRRRGHRVITLVYPSQGARTEVPLDAHAVARSLQALGCEARVIERQVPDEVEAAT